MSRKDPRQRREYQAAYYIDHREEICAQHAEYYKATRAVALARAVSYRRRTPERIKAARIMRQYGLSRAEYDRVLAEPCGICAGAATTLDHSHATGRVRGGLCDGCNKGLGFFQNSPEVLLAAVDYLRVAATLPRRD